jgi:hypothetical protein
MVHILDKPYIINIPGIWGDHVEDFLTTHVKIGDGNKWKGYIKVGPNCYHEVDLFCKIQYEISRGITAFANPEEELGRMSQALKELHDSTVGIGSARTLRMLTFLQSLLVPPGNGIQPSELEKQISKLKKEVQEFEELVNTVVNGVYPTEGEWGVSLSLMTVLAVAYSMCEWHRPVLWEAYSAGRARDELANRWPEEDKQRNKFLDAISYLIRYQSDPGQYYRGTGVGDYLKPEKVDLTKLMFGQSLKSALMVVAFIEEVRNRRLGSLPQVVQNILPQDEDCLKFINRDLEDTIPVWEPNPEDTKSFFEKNSS